MENFATKFWNAKNELENLHKSAKDMTLSLDTLLVHFPDMDLDHLKSAISLKTAELSTVTHTFEEMSKERELTMATNKSKIHTLFDEYKELEKLVQVHDENNDPFMVEMSKLMYPRLIDSLQLRSDPPIYGVDKVTSGASNMFTSGPSDVIVSFSNMQGFIKTNGSPF